MNRILYSLLLVTFFFSLNIQAQYFGQNKVKYGKFDFKVVESKTFDMYHYLKNDSLVIGLIKDAEKWRVRHEQVFKDSFDYKVPIILYNNHGDFQQTTVVGGLIGTTTGGVTEGLKNRVTFPVTPSYAQTDHVMGHELVHAHQYNMIKSSDSLSFNNMANIPLWMTEGMAEYLSIGSIDSHTAMWMRDAVAHDYFPRIKDLHKSRYFPYRFGHAFWAFVGGTFGDDKIRPLYEETAKLGVKEAFKRILSMPIDSFSNRWKETTENFYKPQMQGRDIEAVGTKLIDSKNGGRLNITPSVSPDGKYFIFLSEKNIFSLDLFIANTETGKIIRKISTRTKKSHLDALDAFESAGTWSPDSKKYAFVIYSKGMNKIAIADVAKGKVIDEFFVKDIQNFSNIDWSPDGTRILFSGLKNGQSDLFTVDLKTKNVVQLTNDYYANMQPKWSSDGKQIVYVTDNLNKGNRPTRNLSFMILNLVTNKIHNPKILVNANNLNPNFSADGKTIFFLSDRDGFRDIYKYEIETGTITQLTKFFTGVSGITKYAPAISVSRKTKEILYSHYNDSKYNIYKVKVENLQNIEIEATDVNMAGAKLPSMKLKESFVDTNLKNENIVAQTNKLKQKDYKPKFKLDYISNGGVGISTGRYGTGMAGGVNMLFGDMLGENQLYVGVVLNGELQDFGGQAAYLNRESRYAWGGGLSHIPYRYVTYGLDFNATLPNSTEPAIKETYNLYRIFKEQVSLFSYYPFSKSTRIEGGTSFNYYSFRLDRYNNYYDGIGRQYIIDPKDARERNIDGAGDPFAMQEISMAYVGDNSSFGLTAPMKGYRFRFELQQTFGRINMTSVLADARKYFYLKPVTFAFKAYHYSRLGEDASNDLMPPLYLGYESLIRGYTYSAILNSNSQNIFNNLQGSKMLLSNFEIRFPFTGPERLALIKSNFLFTDLNLFVDAGLAWGEFRAYDSSTNAYYDANRKLENSKIITSMGISTRINLFGQLIIEPYYAFPMQLNGETRGVFGINFTPGW